MVKQSQSRAQQQRRRRLFLLQRRHNGGTKDQWAPVMTVMMMMMTRLSLSRENIRKTVPEPFVFVFLFGILPTRNKSTARIFSFESRDVCSCFFLSLNGQIWRMAKTSRHVWVHLDVSRSRPGDLKKKGRNKRGPFYNLLRCYYRLRQTILKAITGRGKKKNKSTTFICRLSIV